MTGRSSDPRIAGTVATGWSVSFLAAAIADIVVWLNLLLSTVVAGLVLAATVALLRSELGRMAKWRDERFSVKAGAAVIYGYSLIAFGIGVFVYAFR